MKKIIIITLSAAVLILLGFVSFMISKSAEDIDVTTENEEENYIVLGKVKTLPEDITIWSEDGQSDIAPAAWKVTAPNGNVIYMCGTMHALKDECYPLPGYLKEAYEQADVLAVEIENTDMSAMFDDEPKMLLPENLDKGDTLEKHLSAETYDLMKKYLEKNGENIEDYESYMPWFALSNLTSPKTKIGEYNATIGIDRILQISAHIDEKEVLSLETEESKVNRNCTYSEELLDLLINKQCGMTDEERAAETDNNYNAWKNGDMEAIYELSYHSLTDYFGAEVQPLENEYNRLMLTDRNKVMYEKAKELIDSDTKTLLAVGMAHFVGDDGLIALFEKDGYNCEIMNN